MKNKIVLFIVFLVGTIIHIYFMKLNEILKVADSFAYLQMSNYFQELSINGFGTGWFGFLYSIPISFINFFLDNNFLSAQILNIFLFNFSGILLYIISKKYLNFKFRIILLILFFLSPILLHFNIAILSENIYLPIFLLIVILSQNFLEKPQISDAIAFGFLITLMYYTRGEAFIYLGAIGLISFFSLLLKKINFLKFLNFNILLILSFFIFISPYIFYLHSFTGEWGLSNKGSSNLRQALLRGKKEMDDKGFEKAVAELTPDSKHLISGFAGGLKYDKPQTGITLKKYIFENKTNFINNWGKNIKKLYLDNIIILIDSNSKLLYSNIDSAFFYKNKLFLLALSIPILLFFIGLINLYQNKKKEIIIIMFSFMFIASTFFTLFFILNRYFIIFIPLFLIIILYGIQTIDKIFNFSWTGFTKKSLDKNKISIHNIFQGFLIINFIGIYLLGLLSYYNSYKDEDTKYYIKKEAGLWLKKNSNKYVNTELKNLNILERFPIITYYSTTNNRFITPYTSSLTNLLIYSKFNKIDYLIVDNLDFKKYRPDLIFLLNEEKEFVGLKRIKIFKKIFNGKEQKIIIYKIKKIQM